MKRLYWLVPLILIALIVVGGLIAAPGFIRGKILDEVRKACRDCVVNIGDVDLSLLNPGTLTLHDVRFNAGQAERSMVQARLQRLVVDVALTQSSREKIIVNAVTATGADIVYADGDAPEIPSPKDEGGGDVLFEIQKTRLEKAVFRYAHTNRKKTSILHIDSIDAEMSAIGNTPEARDRMTTAKLTGRIEKSGRGQLDLAALVRPGPWYVDAALEIHDQSLEALNRFFTPNDRIELKGIVEHAIAKVNVRDRSAKANVMAVYRDAGYKEFPSGDRSPIEATLASLGASIMMTKTNVDFPPDKQRTDITVELDEGEPLVHYMLRSAKLGLLDVAKKKK